MAQTEQGDIFKITLNYQEEKVNDMKIQYFDTIPPATSLLIFKAGFLFAASEFGNQ